MKKSFQLLLILMVFLINPFSAWSQEKIRVAVAANFIQAFKEIAERFEAKTKIKVEATFSSTGNLYSQIVNGAPYDLFLSADEEIPARLHKDGLGEAPFLYAEGRDVLWSTRKDFCRSRDWREALKNNRIKKISLANPVTSPYGAAAKTALQKAGLWDALQPRLVNAQDVSQSFQYASTGAVEAGFCSLSITSTPEGQSGCFLIIPEAPAIIQFACLLKNTKNRETVKRFLAFLLSSEADQIKIKYGYK
ncbi:MAG: molybdate ABC transporter substrate-binding protein [Thermodesulfobacteriota bacterium]|jgi:molybdate transport system substrate-binding protein